MSRKQSPGVGFSLASARCATGAARPPPVQFCSVAAWLRTHDTLRLAPQAEADLANNIQESKASSASQFTLSPLAYLLMIAFSCCTPGLSEASSKGQYWSARYVEGKCVAA